MRDRADDILIPWKEGVLEYLDANIGAEAVAQFHELATKRHARGDPRNHLALSRDEHLRFLLRQKTRIEEWKLAPKKEEKPSGKMLPRVESFAYKRP